MAVSKRSELAAKEVTDEAFVKSQRSMRRDKGGIGICMTEPVWRALGTTGVVRGVLVKARRFVPRSVSDMMNVGIPVRERGELSGKE